VIVKGTDVFEFDKNKLQKMFKHQPDTFEPFIRYIRFPKYKNLTPGTQIEFNYPITVLVGENGTNKSSIIRALYGAPGNNSVGTFWFSTSLDPISESGSPNCFIYGYNNAGAGKLVEVLKTRSKYNKNKGTSQNPDYWEPSRPILKYGMERMDPLGKHQPIPDGRSATRWNAIEKEVSLLDFRTELSAYDKYFYHGNIHKTKKIKTKQDFIRHKSQHLLSAIVSKNSSYIYYGREKIEGEVNRELNDDEIAAVSFVLGRKYERIEIISHNFFKNPGTTVRMKSSDIMYSEAFAGSGEFAAVMLIVGVINLPENSLILFDEPEVSLHPGAQARFMKFLEFYVIEYKHQVLISTHSPAIIRHLPPDAIKTLTLDTQTNHVALVSQSSNPEDAFFYIGEPVGDRLTVIVEDKLAACVVERALKYIGPHFSNYDIRYFPGGADTLWNTYIPVYAASNRENIIILFDGDKRPASVPRNSSLIPDSENYLLFDEIKKFAGTSIDLKVDGNPSKGGNQSQLFEAQRNFLDWALAHVRYMVTDTPEQFICEHSLDLPSDLKGKKHKDKLVDLTKRRLDRKSSEDVTSSEILTIQQVELAKIAQTHVEFETIRASVQEIVESRNV
jgi:hypothetical protein